MKLGIMQPYFLPYIGYWQLLNAVDKYIIYDDVNFIKGGWINRNRMLINGEAKLFNIQMQGSSANKLINEIEISSNYIWKRKFIKSIELNYNKAPFYKEGVSLLEEIINFNENNLSKFIENSIRKISEYLDIKTEIILSSDIKKNSNLKNQDKVIDICKVMKADEYYNAIGGMELYSFEDFYKNNIKLKFLKTHEIKYKQFNDKFIENLSILDLIMFNSKEELKEMLNRYDLVERGN